MISCTYERGNNIIGWHRHTTQGEFIDVAGFEFFGMSNAFVAVRRDNGIFIETYYDNEAYMDSFVTFVTPGTTTLSGLDHLEGMEVQVKVDGALLPNKTVSGGSIEIEYAGDLIFVGLQYISTLKPMPVDKGVQGGSGRSLARGWNKIYVQIIDSALPLINGQRPPDRSSATLMDTPEPLVTEQVFVTQLGYGDEAIVEVVQDLPYPCIVGGIFGELDQNVL